MGGRGASSGGGSGGGGGGAAAAAKSPYTKPTLSGGKPALTGSEKQTAWAHTLRESYIAVNSKTHPETTAKTVAAHPDAKYWIDNRYGLGSTNAAQRDMQKLWSKK